MKNFLLILILFLTQVSEARFMKLDDAQGKMNFYNIEVKVNKNGSFDEYIEFEYEILKEGGRQSFTNFQLSFNENISEIEILNAKTIFQKKTYNVNKKDIESKPLASSKKAFDQLRQVSIPFKKTEIGAKIYLKYRTKTFSSPLENHFDSVFSLGGFNEKYHLLVNSEIPLYIKANDPQSAFLITAKNSSSKTDSTYNIIDIKLKRPFTDGIINEAYGSTLSEKNSTWISVSSAKNWEEVAINFAKKYDEISSQKLPKPFKEIAQQASKQRNEIDQINFVTSSLMKKIHYLANWMTVKGRFIPRNLDEIAKTQYGDCKDFTISTVAVLKALGYNADPVFVYRGPKLRSFQEVLPGIQSVNHAMLRVVSHSGKTYWMDPTNIVSMANDIFMDVSDRKGLVLNSKNPGYINIPKSDYNKAKIYVSREFDFSKDHYIVSFTKTVSGRKMIPYTIDSIYSSREQFIDDIYNDAEINMIPNRNRLISDIPTIIDRNINEYSYRIKYVKKPDYIKTNYGNGIKLAYRYLPQLHNIPEDSKGDIFIGEPCILERVTVFKNRAIKNIDGMDTEIKTPWMSMERKAKIHNGNTQITDKIYFLQSIIKNEDFQTKEFKKLSDFLLENYNNPVIVLD